MPILPEHSDAQYMSRLPLQYDYNAIYTQMENQMQLENYDAQLAQADFRKINLEFGRVSAEDFIRIHYTYPQEELQEYERKLQTVKTDVEKKSLEMRKKRCQIEIYNCVRFMQDFIAKNGGTDPGYRPVSFKEIQDRPSITRGRRMAFRRIAAQYKDNPPVLPDIEDIEEMAQDSKAKADPVNSASTASAEEVPLQFLVSARPEYNGSYKCLLPIDYDYNKIYTQLELQSQLESYPPQYPYHVGEDLWDIKYGRVTADAFAQAHYYDILDTLMEAHKYRHADVAKLVQRYIIERDNCVKFMEEFVRRKGYPRDNFQPVRIQYLGDETYIAMGRCFVFEDIVSRTQPMSIPNDLPNYNESYMSLLPEPYDYNAILLNQLATIPLKFETPANDKYAAWNGWDLAEYFFFLHNLCPTVECVMCEEKYAAAKTREEKEKLQNKIRTCHMETDNCIHFMRDFQDTYTAFDPADTENFNAMIFGTYEVFASILKQLHFGTDLFHVKSRWKIGRNIPEADPENADTIWEKYKVIYKRIYHTSKGRTIET